MKVPPFRRWIRESRDQRHKRDTSQPDQRVSRLAKEVVWWNRRGSPSPQLGQRQHDALPISAIQVVSLCFATNRTEATKEERGTCHAIHAEEHEWLTGAVAAAAAAAVADE